MNPKAIGPRRIELYDLTNMTPMAQLYQRFVNRADGESGTWGRQTALRWWMGGPGVRWNVGVF